MGLFLGGPTEKQSIQHRVAVITHLATSQYSNDQSSSCFKRKLRQHSFRFGSHNTAYCVTKHI